MFAINKKLIVVATCVLANACTQIDDYMLGKDNTPTPTALEPIKAKEQLVENWAVPVGSVQKKASANLKLKPTIVANTIYTADSSGFIQAVEQASGKLLWSKKLNHSIVSGPSVAAGTIAVATDASTIVLLKQADGSELWQAKVSSEVLAKPVIVDNKVIAKTIDGNLYALNLANGEKVWLSEHGAPSLILKASSSPVVLGSLILVGYSDGKMDAVDIQTGHLVWQRSIAYATGASDVERLVDIDADPIVQGQVAYLASYQGYVGALSLTDGQFIWRKPASVYRNMTIDGNTVYLTDSDDVVWAINKRNGQVNWKQVALKARGLTEPVLLGNRLVVGDKTGLLHILSTKNGDLISRTQLGGAVATAPSVSGNNVYVMTTNGKLSRFSVS